MGLNSRTGGGAIHLSVINGSLMQKSDEKNPLAVAREYEDKNGNKKTKHELVYDGVSGRITDMKFRDGDFGEQFTLVIQDGEDKFEIHMPTSGKYFADFGKKIPNVNLSEDVEVTPYSFEGDNGRPLQGMTIRQSGEKLTSYFWDGKKSINGIPDVSKADRKDYDSDSWKIFFIKVKKFLKKTILDIKIPTLVADATKKVKDPETVDMTDDTEDLPF